MANTSPEPDDILSVRPGGECRAGTTQLLRASLGLLRQHGLRAWLLAVLTLAILSAIMTLVFAPLTIVPCVVENLWFARWWWGVGWPAATLVNIIVGAPFSAALAFAMLLLLQHRRAGAETLLRPFRNRLLLANVAMAGSAAPLLHRLLRSVPWSELQPGIVQEDSLLWRLILLIPAPQWLIRNLPHWFAAVVAVPLAWAALNALVLRQPWFTAITRSARLALRYWRLAAAYLAITLLLPLIHWIHAPINWAAGRQEGGLCSLLFLLDSLSAFFVSSIVLLLETLALVLVYREMAWREREAAGATTA